MKNYFCILLQEEEWARQEALRIQQQEDEEAAKRAALQPPPASDQRYDLPPEVCMLYITNYEYYGGSVWMESLDG